MTPAALEAFVRRFVLRDDGAPIAWAVNLLMNEHETPSLLVLAGMDLRSSPSERDHYFLIALDELLEVHGPPEEEARKFVAHLLRQLLDGNSEPRRVSDEVDSLYNALHHPEWISQWMIVSNEYFNVDYRNVPASSADAVARDVAAWLLAELRD